jgi:integrase
MKNEKLPRGIRRRGNSLYVYLTHPDGKFELRSVGMVSAASADMLRKSWQKEIAENKYIKPKPRTDMVPLADICDKAVEHYKNYTRAWDGIEGRVAVFKQWWPGRAAESIADTEIEAKLLANVAPNGLQWTKCTSNEYRVTLLRIFALAIKRKEITVNPVASVERHKLENERHPELSLADEDRLREAIRKLYPEKEPEFDLALHLGCRRSNLYGQHNSKRVPMEPLQWEHVNLNFRVVTFKRSKSGKFYRVPINDTALAAFKKLRERCDGTGPVMRRPRPRKTNADGRQLQSCRKWFESCLAEAKIVDFTFHDLRHIFASRLREANVQIEDIRYLIGHGAKSITERYAHPNLDVLRAAVAKLDRKPKTETDTKTDTASVLQFKSA